MDEAKYIAQVNVNRFRDQLENAAERSRRDLLLRLLVKQERTGWFDRWLRKGGG